ncbi:MAG: NTP transferase domain-containing protein [Bacteroidales bacterium]|nr:NTP transferase domain-containing protein [Bacteroidales bacterium]
MKSDMRKTMGFVFAAGLGTRLYPLTADRPKALVKYDGTTLLERVLRRLTDAGIERIVVNVHHFPDQIIDFLKKLHFPADIIVSDERAYLRDTAGGLKFAAPFLKDCDRLLLHNVDILSDLSIENFVEEHLRSGADVTLAVKQRETSRYLVFDSKDMRLIGWHDRRTDARRGAPATSDSVERAFSGIHIIDRKIVESIPSVEKSSITDFYLQICQNFKIIGYEHNSDFWQDVGKYDQYINHLS